MTSQKLTAALFGLMILLLGVGNAAAQARNEVFLPFGRVKSGASSIEREKNA